MKRSAAKTQPVGATSHDDTKLRRRSTTKRGNRTGTIARLSRSPHAVKNVMDALGWPLYILGRAMQLSLSRDDFEGRADFEIAECRNWLDCFCKIWFAFSLGTSFSGIDSPGQAAHCIDCMLTTLLGLTLAGPRVRCLYAVEIDAAACEELKCAPPRA